MIYTADGNEYKNPQDAAKAKRNGEKLACAWLAGKVHNNEQLRELLRQAQPSRRRDVYNMILPHLKFRPLGFSMLV